MKSKCTGSICDVKTDNLTLEVTDGSPADATTESTCNNKGSSKWKSTGQAPSNAKRSKHGDYDEIDV